MPAHGAGLATVADVLRVGLIRYPDRVAIVADGIPTTYAELFERSSETANVLHALGVRRGDHVGVILPNGSGLVRTLFASALLGAVFVPLNPRSMPNELAHSITKADLAVVVMTSDDSRGLPESLEAALPGLSEQGKAIDLSTAPFLRRIVSCRPTSKPWTTFYDEVVTDLAPGSPPAADAAQVSAHDDALLLFTSGTTAGPKACRLRHGALVRNACAAASPEAFGLSEDDRVWNPLPMFHTGGIMPMLAALSVGASLSTTQQFSAVAGLQTIESERITMAYPAFPALYGPMLDEQARSPVDASSLRVIAAVGNATMLQQLRAGFPDAQLLNMYGATETSGIICYNRPTDGDEDRLSTCGWPFDGVDVRIVDIQSGERIASGLAGEILVSGYAVFAGYHQDPDATESALRDGWFHTGDLGRVDADGRLTFCGRLKEMLKVGGENVSPLEIESCLMEHPAVRLAQVVGRPDDRWGDVVVAFIEFDPSNVVPVDELGSHCASRLSKFKVPREFHVVTEWPMSATKVQKSKLLDSLP